MSAVLLTGHGGLEKNAYRDDVPVPCPKAGELLIEVAAAGINNTDINTRTGWYSKKVKSETSSGGAEGGVRPSGWTESGRSFDPLLGVLILELRGAEIAER